MHRELFKWKVTIVNPESGSQKEVIVHNYWDPNREGVPERVAVATAATATYESKKQWVPSGDAVLVPDEELALA